MSKNSTSMPKQGQICWTELTTRDAPKAKSFYHKLFGWEFTSHPVAVMDAASAIKEYTCFKLEDNEMGGILQIPTEGECANMPTRWISYIYVNDIEAMAAQAKELGATIKVPVTDVGDFGRFCILLDPTGAEIAFWQQVKSC